MKNFKVIVFARITSVAEVTVSAENEEDARNKAYEMAFDNMNDDDYEIVSSEYETEIGRSFKEQKLIFHHGGHEHVLSFVPTDGDYWESFKSEGFEFDVHYDEESMDICVYVIVQNESGNWEQYITPVYKQEVKQ